MKKVLLLLIVGWMSIVNVVVGQESVAPIYLKFQDESEVVTETEDSVNVTQQVPQPQVLQRTWANLERGLKEIMQSPEMLSNNITEGIRYIYKIEDIPCYGELYLCLSLKDNMKEYVLSRTNPLVDGLDITSAINITSCRTGSDDGVNINTPEGQIPRRIPRRTITK